MPFIQDAIKQNSIVLTDENAVYNEVHRLYGHFTVKHSAKQYVDWLVSTNGIENFWSHLKRGINGIYHWVSREHLQAYVDEYTYRYNTKDLNTSARFNLILENVAGRLTYKELTK